MIKILTILLNRQTATMQNKIMVWFSAIFLAVLFFGNFPVANAYTNEPLAWWSFDNSTELSSGLVKDKNGIYNGQNFNGVPVSGYSVGALFFDLSTPLGGPGSGNGDGFTVGSIPELSQLTVTFRMKTDNSTNATQSVIIANNSNFNIQIKNNVLGIGVPSGSLERTLIGDQSWHYYVVSYDGRNINLYVDGTLKGFATAAATGKTVAGTWSFVSNGFINGQNNIVNKITIDDLKVYNRVFGEAEITYEKDNNQLCYADTWSCSEYATCSAGGTQTRTCTKTFECPLVDTPSPSTSQSCTPPTPLCTADSWKCTDWNTCSVSGNQTRSCNKINTCEGGTSALPTFQSCTPPPQPITPVTPPPVYQPPQPSCTADTWSCGDWNSCSLSGVQNRSCRKTFDCPSVETAPPITDQYCEPANKPTQQVPPDSSEISNQDTIIKATVKLICPLDENRASQGSGTVIDPSGTIRTNKHVISGTLGCLVGFINNFNDEPYFGDRQIADITKVSSNEDVAVLKLRNPQNRKLLYIDITKANSNSPQLGTKINIYGYPAKFGTNITYTSGDFSGTSGSYLKTTAIIEHGNSGGGAYLSNGMFIGMPSAVIKGELNALGYILSINTINAWLGNSSVAYNNSDNNYSRVSAVLDKINLKKLDSLKLVIPDTKQNKATTHESVSNSPNAVKQSAPSQVQREAPSVELVNPTPKIDQNNKNLPPEQQKEPKTSLIKRFISWFLNLF